MNKTELVAKVVDITDLSKKDAEAAVDAVLVAIEKALLDGDTVKLSGFGIFEKKVRGPRIGTNPSNQQKIEIPASATVSFKLSKTLKEKLN